MSVFRSWRVAATLDIALVVVFLLVGGAAHDSATRGPAHLLALAACFLVALAGGWGVARAWRAPERPWPTGVLIWVVTVAGGVILRGLLVPDAGFAPTFLMVAAGFLGVALVGWRALAALAGRVGRGRDAGPR